MWTVQWRVKQCCGFLGGNRATNRNYWRIRLTGFISLIWAYPFHGDKSWLGNSVWESSLPLLSCPNILAEQSEGVWLYGGTWVYGEWGCRATAKGMADIHGVIVQLGKISVSLVSLSDTRWMQTSSSLLCGSVFAYMHAQKGCIWEWKVIKLGWSLPHTRCFGGSLSAVFSHSCS